MITVETPLCSLHTQRASLELALEQIPQGKETAVIRAAFRGAIQALDWIEYGGEPLVARVAE